MAQYRRVYFPGGSFFFTIVVNGRKPIFKSAISRKLLREAWSTIHKKYPFTLVACCLLPEHLHCIWTMPENDSNYSMRWKGIKGLFSKEYNKVVRPIVKLSKSMKKKREAGIWQRRFWEHTFCRQEDFNAHIDYIHYNPVKHGLVKNVSDWPWSTFHKYVKQGIYPAD